MENLTNHHVPVKSPDVAWQSVDGEAVILHIRKQMLRGFNSVGSCVWQLIDGNRTLAEIAKEISVNFSRAEEEVREDVKIFMVELLEKNMVTFPDMATFQ